MSISNISFLTEQQQDIRSPEFAKVLKGFDPMEVEAYVYQVVQHIEALEREMERLQSQRDAAEDHYNSVVEDAYQQVAGRMAEVIRAADHYVEKLRVDSEAESKRRVAEATRQAEAIRKEAENDAAQIRAEAEAEAEQMRHDGQQELAESRSEVDRILGGLVLRRDEMLGEFADIRQKVLDVIGRIDVATAAAKSRRGVPVTHQSRPPGPANRGPSPSPRPQITGPSAPAQATLIPPPAQEPRKVIPDKLEPSIATDDDDLLTLPHGFDLVLGGLFEDDEEDGPKGNGLS